MKNAPYVQRKKSARKARERAEQAKAKRSALRGLAKTAERMSRDKYVNGLPFEYPPHFPVARGCLVVWDLKFEPEPPNAWVEHTETEPKAWLKRSVSLCGLTLVPKSAAIPFVTCEKCLAELDVALESGLVEVGEGGIVTWAQFSRVTQKTDSP